MDEWERHALKIKLFLFGIAVFLVFSLLTSRLWKLQIAEGSEFAAKAKGNVMRYVSIPGSRGDIVDSKGKVLATNVPQFAITLDWLDMQNAQGDNNAKQVVRNLARYVKDYWGDGKEPVDNIAEDILAKIQMHQFARYEPVVVMDNIPLKLQAVLAEHQQELPGISVEARSFRTYPQQSLAGQLIGYVREVGEGELGTFQAKAEKAGLSKDLYEQGDLVGKMGVENYYDLYLKGQDGVQLMEVDNMARPVSRLTRQEPVVGRSLQLNIDLDLQKAIDESMSRVINEIKTNENSKAGAGAAVVIDVKTGKVLAMVSKPDMNPNELVGDLSDNILKNYFGSKQDGSPRLGWSRAFQETYAPGSTFKMLTGMAALQEGVVNPYQKFLDVLPTLANPKAGVAEWKPGGFGYVNLFTGLANSVDIYFEKLGELTFAHNPEAMAKVATEFGLGRTSGIDLPGESTGTVPSPQWKKNLNEPSFNKRRDAELKKLDDQMNAELAQTSDDKQKKKIQATYNAKKQIVIADYNINYKYEVGWQPYDTYNTSMGQGDNKYTMLQLANYVATIVNGGKHMKPYLVDRIYNTNTNETVTQFQPTVLNQVSVSPENLDYIKQAMRAVVTSGTAGSVFLGVPGFTGGAKTGTAQLGSVGTAAADEYNGTFVAFTPYDNPEIAFAGVIEYGHHGGTSAGEVAADAFTQYYKERGWLK